jgi:hypothetical protein
MISEIKAGTILIKNDALLPQGLAFESEPCAPSWKIVTDFDGYGLDRKIGKEGWTFFCLANEIKAGVFGVDGRRMVRRAVERILKSPSLERFNSLEIKGVTSTGSARFPGIWHVTVSARPRHVQRGLFLFGAEDFSDSDARTGDILGQNTGLPNRNAPHSNESVKEAGTAPVMSS